MVDPLPDPERNSAPDSAHRRDRSLFDWLFRNPQTGQLTIAQFPNVPLWIFFATVVLRWLVPTLWVPKTRSER